MARDPIQIRDLISTAIETLPVLDGYKQLDTDAWRESEQPFADDLDIGDAPWEHLLYYVDVRDSQIYSHERTGLRNVALFRVFAICLVQTLGEKAIVNSAKQALLMARHLWYGLADTAQARIGDVTFQATDPTSTYGWAPITNEAYLVRAQMPVIFTDSLEA